MAEADQRGGDFAAAYAAVHASRHAAPGSTADKTAQQHVHRVAYRASRARPDRQRAAGRGAPPAPRKGLRRREGRRDGAVGTPRRNVEPTDVLRVVADALYGLGETERALAVLRELWPNAIPTARPRPTRGSAGVDSLEPRSRRRGATHVYEEFRRRYPKTNVPPRRSTPSVASTNRRAAGPRRSQTYRELAYHYPRSKFAGEAQWRIGWIQYQTGNWTAAAATFGQVADRDQLRDEADYWQGRALQRAGRAAAARQLYRGILQRNPKGTTPCGRSAAWVTRLAPRCCTPPRSLCRHRPAADPPPVADTFHLVAPGSSRPPA